MVLDSQGDKLNNDKIDVVGDGKEHELSCNSYMKGVLEQDEFDSHSSNISEDKGEMEMQDELMKSDSSKLSHQESLETDDETEGNSEKDECELNGVQKESEKMTRDILDKNTTKFNHRRNESDYELFKQQFNAKMFKDIDDNDSTALKAKIITSSRYDLICQFLTDTESSDKVSSWQKKKTFGNSYKMKKKYSLDGNDLYFSDPDSKRESLRMKRKVAKMLDIFDIIHEKHFGSSGHRGASSVWNSLKGVWWNISEEQCKEFTKLCPFCQLCQPTIKPHKGSVKPIRTYSYRDRFQVDLIDFSQQACYDLPNDFDLRKQYKYIMVVRDHFTRFIILRPLQGKFARLVAMELAHVFSIIGFPLIIQTDNGGEFVAEEVIRELNLITPYAHAVKGRSRTPRDQGSVEVANKMIKRIITKTVPVMQQMGITDANWVMALPRVMTAVNSGRNKGADEMAPYDAVFGMSYDHPIISANAINFVQNENLQDRAKRIGGTYRNKMVELDEMKTCADAQDSVSIPLNKFTFNKEAKTLITKRNATFYTQSQALETDDMFCMPCVNQEDLLTNSDSVNSTLESLDGITSDEPFDGKKVESLIEGRGKPFHPYLICNKCDQKDGYLMTTIFPTAWLETNYVKDTKSWFSWQFVLSYSLLLKHLYEQQLTKLAIIMMDPDYKSSVFRGNVLASSIEQCASIVIHLSKSHFAVILCEIKESHIYIIDGLYNDPMVWKDHAFKLLQEIDHPLKMSDIKILNTGLRNFNAIQQDPKILTMSHKEYIQQNDGWNCGPIACTVLHSLLLNSIENYGTLIEERRKKYDSNKAYVDSLRKTVVTHYSTMVYGLKDNLTNKTDNTPARTEMTNENTVEIDANTEDIVVSDVEHSDVKASKRKGTQIHLNENQLMLRQSETNRKLQRMHTNDKMIKRQKQFAEKNQAAYYKNTAAKKVKLGDYVRVKVDTRDRYLSNYSSLGGIVLCIIPDIFSIQVVTNDGILSTTRGNSRRTIPVSEYEIVSEGVVETTEFKNLRVLVLSSTINEDKLRKFGMKEMHKLQVLQYVTEQDVEGRLRLSKERQTKKTDSSGQCKCKNGNCTFRCGCCKKNIPSCGGLCSRGNLGKKNRVQKLFQYIISSIW